LTPPSTSARLRALFETGTVRAVAGNAPFLLEGADRLWYVRTGQLELFLVRAGDDASRGVRHHFLSAVAGDLLFGMDASDGLVLLASGVVGTEVVEVPLSALRALMTSATHSADRADVVERVDRWVAAVSAGVTRHITPRPRADVLLDFGAPVPVPEGSRVRPPRGVAWVRQYTGTALFIGMEETPVGGPVDVAPRRMPVTQDTWLQSLVASEFDAVDTTTALADGSLWPSLTTLHGLMLACEAYNTSMAAVDEYNRLAQKAARRQQTQQDTLAQLASVLSGPASAAVAVVDSDDPLFLACAAVGQAGGMAMQLPRKRADDARARTVNPLVEIAKASRIRTRPVSLDRQWWRTDQGPMLGYLADGAHPVALLPTSHDAYALFDPRTRRTTPVTAVEAALLSPGAVMFYANLGTEVVTGFRLLQFGLRDCGPDLVRVALMALAGGAFGLVMPVATGLIFSSIVPQAQRGQLMQLGIGLAVAAVAALLFQITQALAVLRVENRLDARVNAAVMDRILTLPTAFFRAYSSGDLGTRAMAFTSMRQVVSGAVLGAVFTSVTALPSVGLIVYYDPRLALVAIGVLLVTLAITVGVGYRQLQRQRTQQRLEGRLAGVVLEILAGISKLRVAGAESYAFGVWAKTFGEKRRVAYAARVATNVLSTYYGALPVLASVVVFAGVAFTPREVPFSTGTFLAFNAAFMQVLMATIVLGTSAMSMMEAVPLYQRVRPILEAVPELRADQQDPGELSGEIELSHVSFRYDPAGPYVLHDVSFQARPGEFVAIVGPSGSGKSTLLRLLLGFETPERGAVQYDGQNLAALDVSAVRRQLGVVLQHSKIMPGDIFRNIVGSTLLTIDDAWEAARRAALDEDIKLMPMGMHTMISEGGGTFSGGQRQRLLIARALAQGPRMLFFDEATSALDNTTQAVVSASLDRLQATRVVIAHRLSTVMNADRIHVMVAGRIVQSGTYAELIAEEGVFLDLVQRQLL
jgi:ATP-binding cassette subfamily C protein